MRVLKFGGMSLENKNKMLNVCKYIKQEYKKDKQLIIVVSAMGHTTKILTKLAKDFGYINQNRELAILLSTGEVQSASLMCIMLESLGVPAKSFSGKDIELTTFGDYLSSKVAYINKTKIIECLNENKVAIVCGFQGVNKDNEITTLGLGGSDTTAVALACCFDVQAEIYSNYDGVFCGDPKILPFKKIKNIDYTSMLKMSKAGAKVLDEKAVELARNHQIKIISKSSYLPNNNGSTISTISDEYISITSQTCLEQITINFNNESKLNLIIKNVLNCLNNIKFYNLKINQNEINFYIPQSESKKVISNLSTKLKLVR